MKTRKDFEAKVIRDAERSLGVHAGWWGTWRHLRGPLGYEVKHTGKWWSVRYYGVERSRHDSRASAISKAKRMGRAKP